jgi:hypothetical protein
MRRSSRATAEREPRVSGYGYELAVDGVHLVAVESEQATMARARALAAGGLSLRSIAAKLAVEGCMSRTGRPFAATQVARIVAGDDGRMAA